MKATGIVRKVDQLGRVVLPMELRKSMDIKTEDPMEIFVEGETIILKKYEPVCVFCGDTQDISTFKGKNICQNCMENLAGMWPGPESLEVPIIEPANEKHLYFMRKALEEALMAFQALESPVGAVIVKGGTVISTAHNEREMTRDATKHAEIIAIGRAGKALGSWNLAGCDMYLTLEPCPMCAGALVQARIKTLYLGAPDPKGGAAGSLMNIPEDGRFNHNVKVIRGILVEECSDILKRFFKDLREKH